MWDRLCTALFAPSIFKVMIQQARETSLKDMLPALQSLGKARAAPAARPRDRARPCPPPPAPALEPGARRLAPQVIIGFTILATGNLLFAGLAYFAWKRLKQQEAQQQ